MIVQLPPGDEIRASLKGAMRIIQMHPKALGQFNLTHAGFWHSFQAFWIALIPYLITMLSHREVLISQNGLSVDTFPNAVFFAAKLAGVLAEWILLPIVLWHLARPLGIEKQFAAFVIVRNWMSVIAIWVFFVPVVCHLVNLVSIEVMVLSQFTLIGFVMWTSYLVARTTLGKPAFFCTALVAADLGLSLIIDETMWSLIKPMLLVARLQ